MKTPYEFQKAAVLHLHQLNVNKCLLALDLGLGKTLTSLLYLEFKRAMYPAIKNVIILCQPIKLHDWRDEILDADFLADVPKDIKIYNHKYGKAKHQVVGFRPVVQFHLISYSSFIRPKYHQEILKNCNVNDTMLIIDESQTIKSHVSSIGKLTYALSQQLEHILLLSGDPMSNGYIDYFNQLRVMGEKMSLKWFKNNFCEVSKSANQLFEKIISYKNVDELMAIVQRHSLFLKTNVVKELPEQNFNKVLLESKEFTKWQDQLIKTGKIKDVKIDSALSMYHAMRQLPNGYLHIKRSQDETWMSAFEIFDNVKLEKIAELYNSTSDSFIIYYNFNLELETLKDWCESERIEYYQINGQQNDYDTITNMYRDGETAPKHVVLIQYQSGSVGINLNMYNRTIYYSPTNSGSNYRQSLKRTHRLGQTNHCFYYQLALKGSIEQQIYKRLEVGQDYSEAQFLKEYHQIISRYLPDLKNDI